MEDDVLEGNDSDFDAGFDQEAEIQTTTPDTSEPIEQAGSDPVVADVVVEEPVEPEYAKITKADYDELLKKAASIDTIRTEQQQRFDQAFGKIGGLQQLVDQLKTSGAGQQVQVSAEDFAEMAAEFPEMAEMFAKGMNNVLSKTRGTGGAAQGLTQADIEQILQQRLKPVDDIALLVERTTEEKLLNKEHKGWTEIIGPKGSDTEFRKWLKTQPHDYHERIINSWNHQEIGEAITTFKSAQEASKKQSANSRKEILAAAITPRGTGGHAPASTEEDDFSAGFSGK